MKILNEALANLEVGLRHGLVQFDERGIADVEPDEYAEELLQVDGYYRTDADGNKELPPVEVPEEVADEVQEPEAPKYDLEGMTGKELDKLAEELEVEDYPKGANVATRKAAIGAFLSK
jgi:hypothetical protein